MPISARLIPMETLKLRRSSTLGQYGEDGYPMPPRLYETSFEGNVQPVSGKEFLQVPEGDRHKEHVNVWTLQELRPDDLIVRFGVVFEVRQVERWHQPQLHLGHYKALAVRKDV